MKKIFFTPGPARLYPTVEMHIKNALKDNIASISHRSKKFEDIYENISVKLKKFLNVPENYHIFFVASATEAMERTIQNCVDKYSFHFVNGSFSKRFFQTAQELGKEPQKIEAGFGEGFDFDEIKIPKDCELICLTQNETSAGIMTPVEEIYKTKEKNLNSLVAVDVVSSVPYVDLNYKLLDIVFFSVQKGFGLPAGLGVMVVSPKALKKAEVLTKNGISTGSYHSFSSLLEYAEKYQTPETPAVLEIYLLGKIMEDMMKTGINKIRKQTEQKAKLIYDFLDDNKTFSAFIKDEKVRSQTVITVNVGTKQKKVKKFLEVKGFIVGSGYGQFKNTQIRIANLPAHSISDIEKLIGVLRAFKA